MTEKEAEYKYFSYMVREVRRRTGLPKKEIWTALHECGLMDTLRMFDGLGFHWPVEDNADALEAYLRTSGRIPKNQRIRLDDWEERVFGTSNRNV